MKFTNQKFGLVPQNSLILPLHFFIKLNKIKNRPFLISFHRRSTLPLPMGVARYIALVVCGRLVQVSSSGWGQPQSNYPHHAGGQHTKARAPGHLVWRNVFRPEHQFKLAADIVVLIHNGFVRVGSPDCRLLWKSDVGCLARCYFSIG